MFTMVKFGVIFCLIYDEPFLSVAGNLGLVLNFDFFNSLTICDRAYEKGP